MEEVFCERMSENTPFPIFRKDTETNFPKFQECNKRN